MRSVALISRKGGTGKTTLAVSLACAARAAGADCALLDLDPQGSASAWARLRGGRAPAVAVVRPSALAGQLAEWRSAFAGAVVFVDTPPVAGGAAAAAIAACDFVLIPCRPGLFDLAAVSGSLAAAAEAGKDAAAVVNSAGVLSPLERQAREALEASGVAVGPTVHNRVAHAYAAAQGLAACESEPGSRAAGEIETLWRWLERRLYKGRTS